MADYLVRGELSGYYMPEEYQHEFMLNAKITGTQDAIGFKPERFSLGIKRQRERLDLVMVYRINRYTESCYNWADVLHSCEITSGKFRPVVGYQSLIFTTAQKSDSISFDMEAGNHYV